MRIHTCERELPQPLLAFRWHFLSAGHQATLWGDGEKQVYFSFIGLGGYPTPYQSSRESVWFPSFSLWQYHQWQGLPVCSHLAFKCCHLLQLPAAGAVSGVPIHCYVCSLHTTPWCHTCFCRISAANFSHSPLGMHFLHFSSVILPSSKSACLFRIQPSWNLQG